MTKLRPREGKPWSAPPPPHWSLLASGLCCAPVGGRGSCAAGREAGCNPALSLSLSPPSCSLSLFLPHVSSFSLNPVLFSLLGLLVCRYVSVCPFLPLSCLCLSHLCVSVSLCLCHLQPVSIPPCLPTSKPMTSLWLSKQFKIQIKIKFTSMQWGMRTGCNPWCAGHMGA